MQNHPNQHYDLNLYVCKNKHDSNNYEYLNCTYCAKSLCMILIQSKFYKSGKY